MKQKENKNGHPEEFLNSKLNIKNSQFPSVYFSAFRGYYLSKICVNQCVERSEIPIHRDG
jgi:2-iminoacetate synthase ThiH